MMKHLLTLLFAASCLTAVGQDNLIGEVYLSFQSSYNTVAIEGCEAGLSYVLQIEGTYGVANGSCNRDAAFGNFDNPEPTCQWVWNDVCDGCQSNRPSPDTYNSNHSYYYPFVASASEQTFHFQDNGGAGDNCGGLTMRIFAGGNAGCTLPIACNYDSEAGYDDGSCLYPDACGECGGDGTSGCTDAYACNFDDEAACDDGSCDYSCCPGPGCCSVGHYWDWEIGKCFDINPADINLDGCVQLNDLLDLLSAYGDCGTEESPWQCGDVLEYQGYDYETVQIGEQCWFAENCRHLPEVSPSSEGSETAPYYYVYGYEGSTVAEAKATDSFEAFGVLYNWPAVVTEGICPTGWHTPSDEDWQTMEISLGMNESEAALIGWRGSPVGEDIKSSSGWNGGGNGSNSSGFNGLPVGARYDGDFDYNGGIGFWWASSASSSDSWRRELYYNTSSVYRNYDNLNLGYGYSARCVRDAE